MSTITLRITKGSPLTFLELDDNFTNLNNGKLEIDGSNSMTGDLNFSGTGLRITGEMSGATSSDRLAFQTSVANGFTVVSAIPNGTGNLSAFAVYDGADIGNSASLALVIDGASTSILDSSSAGTGVTKALELRVGSVNALGINTERHIGIGHVPPTVWNSSYRTMLIGPGTGMVSISPNSGLQLLSNIYEDGTNWRFSTAGYGVAVNIGGGGDVNFFRTNNGAQDSVVAFSGTLGISTGGVFTFGVPDGATTTAIVYGNSFNNGAAGTQVAALRVNGSYGGGISLEDDGGTTYAAFWTVSGNFNIGVGTGNTSTAISPAISISTARVINIKHNGSTGAGIWYDGTFTVQRAFVGMDLGTDTSWRIFSAPAGGNIVTLDLTTGQLSAVSFNATSERAKKKNITEFKSGALERIKKLPLYEFEYKMVPGKQYGTMAEEADERYTDGKSVNLNAVVFDLVKAVQELTNERV